MAILRILIVAVVFVFVCSSAGAESTVKEGAKEVGHGLKTMGTETGKALKEGSKEVGKGLKKVGKGTGEAVEDAGTAAKSVGNESVSKAKRVGLGMWEETKRIGRSVRDWSVETYQKASWRARKIGSDIRDYFKK